MEPMLINLTQLPKELCDYVVLIKFTWLTQENYFELVSTDQGQLMKDFFCFGTLSLIDLFVGSNQLRK